MGKKKRPFYRLVAADSRAPRDGRFIEMLGTYDPLIKPLQVELKEERIIHWLNNGAQPTQTVKSLLRNKGLWLKWDLIKQGADQSKIADEFAKWQVTQEARIKRSAEKSVVRHTAKKTEATAAETEITEVSSGAVND
jgi:small subunit ribosomal protein S16